jgi:hypothetical protein
MIFLSRCNARAYVLVRRKRKWRAKNGNESGILRKRNGNGIIINGNGKGNGEAISDGNGNGKEIPYKQIRKFSEI